jgi:predicted nucleic acid-binding protein
MITAIDTNILIDVFGADPLFGQSSAQLLKACSQRGSLIACDVVWTETATMFPSQKKFLEAMDILGVVFSSLTKPTTLVAAHAWRDYRASGGKRERVIADFLIGAHAKVQADQFLTRDRGFYRKYFNSLRIVAQM